MHVQSKPAILYFGTPVVLISTLNEDGSSNIAPMSSAFWLGWRCLLGLDASSQTTQNLLRNGECVLNLPSEQQAPEVNALALTTGTRDVPAHKAKRGYRHVHAKFDRAGLSPQRSETVSPPRIQECPVQLEAVLESSHGLAENDARQRGLVRICEVRIRRVHVESSLLLDGHDNRIDPDKWRPLIMSFQRFYGLTAREVHASALATISEALYRGEHGNAPDVSAAHGEAAASHHRVVRA